MAKNLINSVSFTVLLVVLLMASTGILNSEATCPGCTSPVFLDECPSAHGTNNEECCKCCAANYPTACGGVIEGTDKHCHCKKNA
ncbi:PREDICTED: defensin-like protein 206 [Camelina sativa]|uniref:Defensin-like protein 206 n=1 Tax=Camelina sativa TaxID=90675 RepID=A0ABM0TG78_CAMSA|nr:PREDICTED: defensin-like protein 206 [Camelina sativa]